jgi:hypothetical protein
MVAVAPVTHAARRLRVCPVCRLCLLTIRRAFVVRVIFAVFRGLARRVFVPPWLMRLAFSCARSGASGGCVGHEPGGRVVRNPRWERGMRWAGDGGWGGQLVGVEHEWGRRE